jgi:hypothetical protein
VGRPTRHVTPRILDVLLRPHLENLGGAVVERTVDDLREIEEAAAKIRVRGARCGPIEEVRPGDVIWFAPGEKHWHGATATIAMTHIAIQETLDGKAVGWMEQVSDAPYPGRSPCGMRPW